MKYIVLALLSISQILAQAQAPSIEWQKSLGGSLSEFTGAIQQTADGGYVVAGTTNSLNGDVTINHGIRDYWIVKLDAGGSMLWQKSLGGSDDDEASSIQQTSDHGYIIAGTTRSIDGDVVNNHGSLDYWLVKLDSSGVKQWTKTYGGSGEDLAYAVRQTREGGYIIAGSSGSIDGDLSGFVRTDSAAKFWIIKTDPVGTIKWQNIYGGSEGEGAQSIEQTSDGGYIAAGISFSLNGDVTDNHGGADYWVVKLDSNGVLKWEKSLGGDFDDYAYAVKQTTDHGYIVAGVTQSDNGMVTGNHTVTTILTNPTADYWIVKLDSNGTLIWEKSLGGTGSDWAYDVKQCLDGGYIVTGVTQSNDSDVTNCHGSADYWVVKLTPSGNIEWQETLGDVGYELSTSIQQTADGGYVVLGSSNSTSGVVTGNHGDSDYWVVKLSASNGISNISANNKVSVYPNPASDKIIIQYDFTKKTNDTKVSIYDLLGQLVSQERIDASLSSKSIDVSQWPSGIYSLRIEDGEGAILGVKRLVKE